MPTVDQATCPKCSTTGTLTIDTTLVAKPLGTFSLSGVQMKVSAATLPRLSCSACDFSVIGRYAGDGRHVEFPDPTCEEQPQEQPHG